MYCIMIDVLHYDGRIVFWQTYCILAKCIIFTYSIFPKLQIYIAFYYNQKKIVIFENWKYVPMLNSSFKLQSKHFYIKKT
jgi:hypothetical protein